MNSKPFCSLLMVLFIFSLPASAADVGSSAPPPAIQAPKAPTPGAGEPWKGTTTVRPFEAGLMSGLSIYGNRGVWSILPSAAFLLKDRAFIADLDNRVWAELQAGPAFFSTGTTTQAAFQYSLHLRWDFNYNETWTVYGLGGFSGYGLPSSLGSAFTFHPRFGAGVEYQTKSPLMIRGEVSAEFIGLGAAFNF